MCEWHRGDTLLKASPLWKPCLLPEAPQVSLKTCFFPQRQLSDISKCWYQVLGVNKDNLFPQQQLKLWRYNGTPPLGSTPKSNQMWLGELEGGDPWVGFSYTGIVKGNVSEKAVLKGGGCCLTVSPQDGLFYLGLHHGFHHGLHCTVDFMSIWEVNVLKGAQQKTDHGFGTKQSKHSWIIRLALSHCHLCDLQGVKIES